MRSRESQARISFAPAADVRILDYLPAEGFTASVLERLRETRQFRSSPDGSAIAFVTKVRSGSRVRLRHSAHAEIGYSMDSIRLLHVNGNGCTIWAHKGGGASGVYRLENGKVVPLAELALLNSITETPYGLLLRGECSWTGTKRSIVVNTNEEEGAFAVLDLQSSCGILSLLPDSTLVETCSDEEHWHQKRYLKTGVEESVLGDADIVHTLLWKGKLTHILDHGLRYEVLSGRSDHDFEEVAFLERVWTSANSDLLFCVEQTGDEAASRNPRRQLRVNNRVIPDSSCRMSITSADVFWSPNGEEYVVRIRDGAHDPALSPAEMPEEIPDVRIIGPHGVIFTPPYGADVTEVLIDNRGKITACILSDKSGYRLLVGTSVVEESEYIWNLSLQNECIVYNAVHGRTVFQNRSQLT